MDIPLLCTSALVVIDIQEKLAAAIKTSDRVIARTGVLLQAAALLKLETIVTEQYPRGLGHTVPELGGFFQKNWPVIEKSSFSCFGEPQFVAALGKKKTDTVIFCGVEAHVCVQQSVFDALKRKYNVIILDDAVASRAETERNTALKLMAAAGAMVTSVESLLFMFMREAKHPAFKQIAALIK